jgi:hypothetical protein
LSGGHGIQVKGAAIDEAVEGSVYTGVPSGGIDVPPTEITDRGGGGAAGALAIGGVICWSDFILEGGITEELTEWDVLKIYAERNLLEKSVLSRDRFQLIAEIAAVGQGA